MKTQAIKIIESNPSKHPLKEVYLDFLTKLNSVDDETLLRLTAVIEMTLNQLGDMEIQLEAYNAIKEQREETYAELQGLKNELEKLEKGELPTLPMDAAGNDESEVTAE